MLGGLHWQFAAVGKPGTGVARVLPGRGRQYLSGIPEDFRGMERRAGRRQAAPLSQGEPEAEFEDCSRPGLPPVGQVQDPAS